MSEIRHAFDLQSVVDQLAEVRQRWRASQHRSSEPGGRELPSREVIATVIDALSGALFPMRLGPSDLRQESEDFYVGHTLDSVLHSLLEQVELELNYKRKQARSLNTDELQSEAHAIVHGFAHSLPAVRELLDSDVIAAHEGDPAAGSVDEVLLCYPGIEAMIHHRLAHLLYVLKVPLLARLVAERAHARTGIDIHPGAKIGPGFFIDHGTGVVIGETAVIGTRVRIYQGVTLGAKRFLIDANGQIVKGSPRHPIIEDDVIIYAGATVLGRITIGKGASIGGNLWITHDVAPGARVTQAQPLREDASVLI